MALLVNDRYALRRLIGDGGMGQVLLAQDVCDAGRFIALKTLGPALDREMAAASLRQEFLTLADLAHPNLVQVFDFGEVTHVVGEPESAEENVIPNIGSPFFTHEFIAGISLKAAVRRLPLPIVLRLLIELVGVVHYIHRQGLLHRDLKPDNVLVNQIGGDARLTHLKLIDFGLATNIGSSPVAAGTLRYVAPELLQGMSADRRSELYSLGVILYEVFAQHPPFDGTTAAEVARAQLSLPPAPLPELVPPQLQQAIINLLTPEPEARPDADALLRVLEDTIVRDEWTSGPHFTTIGSHRMVGREAELEALVSPLRQIRQPPRERPPFCRLMVINGAPGIGKSRLVQALRHQAQVQGIRTLSGQCLPGADVYAGVRTLLAPVLQERPDLFTPEREVLRNLVLDRPLIRLGSNTPSMAPQQVIARVHQAAHNLLETLSAERPLLVTLDDLHFADPESIALLHHVLRSKSSLRLVLVVSSWPSGNSESPLDQLIGDIPERATRVTWLELEGLGLRAVGDLLERALGIGHADPELVQRMRQCTEGNPLFIEELLKLTRVGRSIQELLSEELLPSAVGDAFRSQMDALSENALVALKGLTVWGMPASSSDVAEVTGRERSDCLDGFEEAKGCQLLREQRNGYWFWHGVLMQVMDEFMTDEERTEFHRRAGHFREVSGDPNDPERLGRLVVHFSRADDTQKALHYAVTGARRAEDRFLARRAIELYEQAKQLLSFDSKHAPPDLDLEIGEKLARLYLWTGAYARAADEAQILHRFFEQNGDRVALCRVRSLMGDIAMRRGELESALTHLHSALRVAEDPVTTAEVQDTIAEVHIRRGKLDEAHATCQEAITLLADHPAPILRASILHHLGRCSQQKGDFDDALANYFSAQDLYTTANYLPGMAAIIHAIAQIYHYRQQYEPARSAFLKAYELQEKLGDMEGVAHTLDRLALTTWGLLDAKSALIYGHKSLEASRRLGNLQGEARALSTLGIIYYSRGDYYHALKCAADAIERQRRIGDESGLIVSYQNQGMAYYEIGVLEEADASVQTAAGLAKVSGSRVRQARCDQLLGGIATMQGDYSTADHLLHQAEEVFRSLNNNEQLADILCGMVELELKRSNRSDAKQYIDEALLIVADHKRAPVFVQVHILATRVLLLDPLSDLRKISQELEQVASLTAELGVPELIWQLWELRGRVALKMGRPREACRNLTRAMDTIRVCYDQLPPALQGIFVNDPRRQAVRQALEDAVRILRNEPGLSVDF